MRRVIHVSRDDVVPSEEEVLERLEMPAGATIAPALRALLDDAARWIGELAEPRGVIQAVSLDEFTAVYRGAWRNAPEGPLDLIAPRASALALFVGTVGEAVGREIARHFADGDAASAMVLDAYASAAANRVAYALANEFGLESPLPGERGEGPRSGGEGSTPHPASGHLLPASGEKALDRVGVLPYSPGYCGWHVSGQRALFEKIMPGDIGVTINASCLMTPVKSVSGVLVSGDASVHCFRPAYAFCDDCTTQECVPRMRSMIRR